MSQTCPEIVLICPKIVPKLSQNCPKIFPKLSQNCPKIVPKLSQNCPKIFRPYLRPYIQTLYLDLIFRPFLQTLSLDLIFRPYIQTLYLDFIFRSYIQTFYLDLICRPFIQTLYLYVYEHRCTVVGNPGGGSLGVLAKLFLGGYLGLSENLGGSTLFVFIAFLCDNFLELTPSPGPSPVCIYVYELLCISKNCLLLLFV